MAEPLFLLRIALTLLLLALSAFLYKWLKTPSTPALQTFSKRPKKRNKKKPAKKYASPGSSSPPPQSPTQTPQPSVASAIPSALTAAVSPNYGDSASESDADDGLSAAQVLTTRKFKPKNLGGTHLARTIKASLPPANALKFSIDQKVVARFQGGTQWFPATVMEQRKGNEYHLKYDDGEVEYRVPVELIKAWPILSDDEVNTGRHSLIEEANKSAENAVAHEDSSGSDSSESDDDDGWQVVGTSSAAKRHTRSNKAVAAEPLVDGLTKRQRENRRKKERQREKKELLRQHAQKDDLNARARWRYVPSPLGSASLLATEPTAYTGQQVVVLEVHNTEDATMVFAVDVNASQTGPNTAKQQV
ncbi:hypothetical protein CCR75_002925 [Bremia lactucae]|uniref:Agenet domain-containing protein n=1 Tax=Bremia lactucae TaxID=4779 RepID=A0A976FPT6_BRELC|nr:hypothetical protein CCR75_002925 [Bremia lactucae]